MLTHIKNIDVWIGKTIFHTPVIFLCRLLRCSQYRLHRDLWFIASIALIVFNLFILSQPPSWFSWILVTIFLLRAALTKDDTKSYSSLLFRGIVVFLTVIDILRMSGSLIYNLDYTSHLGSLVFDILILIAEYAVTINTLPPRKPKSVKSKETYRESYG